MWVNRCQIVWSASTSLKLKGLIDNFHLKASVRTQDGTFVHWDVESIATHWQLVRQSKQRGASKAEEFVLMLGRFESLWNRKESTVVTATCKETLDSLDIWISEKWGEKIFSADWWLKATWTWKQGRCLKSIWENVTHPRSKLCQEPLSKFNSTIKLWCQECCRYYPKPLEQTKPLWLWVWGCCV